MWFLKYAATFHVVALFTVLAFGQSRPASTPSDRQAIEDLRAGRFDWTISEPLVAPAERVDDPCRAIKDPSVVFFDRRWHLFCTIRSRKRTHQIEYLSFSDWKDADRAPRHVLKISDGFFCAPQVFYFAPQKKWYLIFQAVLEPASKMVPAYATTTDLADPDSWSRPAAMIERKPDHVNAWLDFWVICDERRAYLFFTSLDGRMWRAETSLTDFPRGWSRPVVALQGDVFEASHTYQLKGLGEYLTLIEAQNGVGKSWRYYKAYVADRLDGEWKPLAATREQPFAARSNCKPLGKPWTDSISHGELIRDGYDQTLQVDPAKLRFLFQGVTEQQRVGKAYGEIPWRLGLLEPAR